MTSFLESRRDWLKVETVDRPDGRWDVVVVIDGTYVGEALVTKQAMVAYFERWLDEELT